MLHGVMPARPGARMSLDELVGGMDSFFSVRDLAKDPSFGHVLPRTYEAAGVDWRTLFEPDFATRFNGLMVRGAPGVSAIFCAAFPSEDVLTDFCRQGREGDLLFLHHPLDMLCGDPRGEWGRGFVPIHAGLLDAVKGRGLSLYVCHAPLDTHPRISTSRAMADALGGSVAATFFPYGLGDAGLVCDVAPLGTKALVERARDIFEVPYADVAGATHASLARLAVVGGCGDDFEAIERAASLGARAYVTGEFRARVDTEFGRKRFAEMEAYAAKSSMSLVGVSHAASEFLVLRTQVAPWIREEFGLEAHLLPPTRWWR